MLPEMSGLQFLAVSLLFAGQQSGRELRQRMKAEGAKIGPSSFSRLMRRLEDANYLHAQMENGSSGCRLVRPRRFEVTDLGLAVWQRVREFYAATDGPAEGLVPIETEEGELAHLPRKKRRELIRRRTHRQVKQIFERFWGRD